MSPVTIAKLVLTIAGIVVFLLGVRFGLAPLRWTGIALVVIAWLLRFADRTGPRRGARPATTSDPSEDP